MRRPRGAVLLAVAVLGVLAAVGAGVLVVRSRDAATPVAVDDALDQYRASSTTGGNAPSRPADGPHTAELRPPSQGVYSYRTTGHDQIDILGGSRHDYPELTTITVSAIDCGVRTRWQPLEQRWDEADWCYGSEGITSPAERIHHEFFGFADDRSWECGPDALALPVDPAPGDEWSLSCTSGTTVSPETARVVGFAELEVDGTPVRTVHIRFESSREDENAGTTVHDDWLVPDTGLLVRREATVDSRSESPVGTATYREQVTLELESLAPQR